MNHVHSWVLPSTSACVIRQRVCKTRRRNAIHVQSVCVCVKLAGAMQSILGSPMCVIGQRVCVKLAGAMQSILGSPCCGIAHAHSVDRHRLSSVRYGDIGKSVALQALGQQLGLIELAVDQPDMGGLFR